MTSSAIKQGLCQALSKINALGSFSCSGVLDACPNPVLHVEDIGTVGLPLSVRDAKAIKEAPATRHSPFGKGSETIVDTSVRKSWQLDPGQFQLRNPRFEAQILSIAQKVCTVLGVACGPLNVRPQLYKLLLYEEGAFFLPHQDSEKTDGMFGTLAVCLPSVHTGGELHLSHNGESRVFKSSDSSEFDYSYAAWYADVTHEVKPVTSGNRLVLIYNLVQTTSAVRTLASTISDTTAKLKAIFSQWRVACDNNDATCPRFLAYKLSHTYTEAALSFDTLKGADHRKVQNLRDAGKDEGFTLYLAHITKEVVGSSDESDCYGIGGRFSYDGHRLGGGGHETTDDSDGASSKSGSSGPDYGSECHAIEEVLESSTMLTRVIDEDGKAIAKSVNLDVADIAQGDIFKRAPDSEDYSGYTGNEGVSTTHIFHDTVVVVMPSKSTVDFRFRCAQENSDELDGWIKDLQAEVRDGASERARTQLLHLCSLVINHNRSARIRDGGYTSYDLRRGYLRKAALCQTAQAALQLGNVLLFEKAVGEIEAESGDMTKDMSLGLFDAIRNYITRLGFASLKCGTRKALKNVPHIGGKWSAMLKLGGGSGTETIQDQEEVDTALREWTETELQTAIKAESSLAAEDGTALAEIAERYGPEMLTQHVVPLVDANLNVIGFALAFVVRLFELRGGDNLPDATIKSLYSQMLSTALDKFDLRTLIAPKEPQPNVFSSNFHGTEPYYPFRQARSEDTREISQIPGNCLVQVLQQCTTLSLNSHVTRLFRELEKSAAKALIKVFDLVIIPYISSLLTHLHETRSDTILDEQCGPHILLLLRQYITRFVRKEPQRPTTWARPAQFITCTCNDCKMLRAFVTDDHRQTAQFSMAERRRRHLEMELRSQGYQISTIRTGSPHTLVATKTDFAFHREHEEWQARCTIAKQALKKLDLNPVLTTILGDKYGEIMGLKMTKTKTAGSQQQEGGGKRKALADSSSNMANGGQGKNKKPRMEVVDLTLD